MAEAVNTVENLPPPSNTAPSSSTPSQPQQAPPTTSLAPQVSASSDLPSQQPQQPQQPPQPPQSQQPQQHLSQPSALAMAPSVQSQPQIQTNNATNTTASHPARAAPGAPGRNYLNTHIAPYLRNGMTNILDTKPNYPLRWLGEYLISQSLIHEGGTDETGVVGHFLYQEHGQAVKRLRPESTTAVVQGMESDQPMADGGVNGVQAKQEAENGVLREDREDTEMGGS